MSRHKWLNVVQFPVVIAKAQALPQPPIGAIEAISRGFESVTNQLRLIVFPILLDLLLWLGPRLSIRDLLQNLLSLVTLPPGSGSDAEQGLELLREFSRQFGHRFNLFSIFSTTPLGVPSLMAGRAPMVSPLGQPLDVQVVSPLLYLVLLGSLYLSGLLLGAIYLGLLAQHAGGARLDLLNVGGGLVGLWGRLFVLAIVVSPILVGMRLMVLVISVGGTVLPILGLTLIVWTLTYLAFSLHGLLEGRGVFRSILDSLRLVQASLPSTLLLLGTVLVLNWGLGRVWNIPADDSWLMLIGILGHAYVVTACFAATLIFYRDRHRWLNEMRAYWAAQKAAVAAGKGSQRPRA